MRLGAIASFTFALGLVLLIAFTGNSDSIDSWNVQDNAVVPAGNVDGAHAVGQTFRSHSARLHAIQVRWVVTSDAEFAPSGQITLHVLRRLEDTTDVATASIATGDIRHNEYGKFVFAPIADSADQSFYFWLDSSKAGIQRGYLSVWSSVADDYPAGQLYIDRQPARRDLVFRAFYDPDGLMLWQALGDMLRKYLRTILFVVIIVILPGLALLFASGNLTDRDPANVVAFTGGMGFAALSAGAFFLLWLDATANTWAGYLWCAGMAMGLLFLLIWRKRSPDQLRVALAPRHLELASLAVVPLALLAFGVALLQIRDTQVPLWVDSPVHAGYIASIVEQAQLPLDRFYHFSYHAIVALVVRLAGVSIPDAMLLVGQLLLVQTGLSTFLLSRRLSGSALAGLASAVAVWFLSPTPAYFVTWGRYPLLLGSALLPLALLCAIDLIERARLDFWILSLAIVTLAGLMFAQVRLVVFYFAFVVVYSLFFMWNHRHEPNAKHLFSRMAILFGVAILLAVLWFGALIVRGSNLQSILGTNEGAPLIDLSVASEVMFSHHGIELLALAVMAVLVGLVKRSNFASTVLTWYICACLLSLLSQGVGGRPLFEPSLVVLMGFLPVALFVGDLVQFITVKLTVSFNGIRIPPGIAGVVLVSLIGLVGLRDMVGLVNPATILFFDADQNAMQWIEEHTPVESRFLINSSNWFESVYVPSDGGSWIPYVAGRSVEVVTPDALLSNRDTAGIVRWMTERKITFVYLGRRAGILNRMDFASQPDYFTLIYDQAGIQIFRLAIPAPLSNRAPDMKRPWVEGRL